MNKSNNMTTFIVVAGALVLGVFIAVLGINLLPNHESSSYYAKVDEDINVGIENINFNDGILKFTTSGDAIEYCIKTTKTIPELNSICWKKLENNSGNESMYKGRRYYIWLKDSNNNISNRMYINDLLKEYE